MRLFTQRKAKLHNGTIVREGDKISFINSDGEVCVGKVLIRKSNYTHSETKMKLKKGTLYFWNAKFNISDYKNAVLI